MGKEGRGGPPKYKYFGLERRPCCDLEYGRNLELGQYGRLRAVDLGDESLGADVIVLVRVDGVQVATQVLQREEADVRRGVAEVGVARCSDAEAPLPVRDQAGRRRLRHEGANSRPEHRQDAMRPLDPVRFVVEAAELAVRLRATIDQSTNQPINRVFQSSPSNEIT